MNTHKFFFLQAVINGNIIVSEMHYGPSQGIRETTIPNATPPVSESYELCNEKR